MTARTAPRERPSATSAELKTGSCPGCGGAQRELGNEHQPQCSPGHDERLDQHFSSISASDQPRQRSGTPSPGAIGFPATGKTFVTRTAALHLVSVDNRAHTFGDTSRWLASQWEFGSLGCDTILHLCQGCPDAHAKCPFERTHRPRNLQRPIPTQRPIRFQIRSRSCQRRCAPVRSTSFTK